MFGHLVHFCWGFELYCRYTGSKANSRTWVNTGTLWECVLTVRLCMHLGEPDVYCGAGKDKHLLYPESDDLQVTKTGNTTITTSKVALTEAGKARLERKEWPREKNQSGHRNSSSVLACPERRYKNKESAGVKDFQCLSFASACF